MFEKILHKKEYTKSTIKPGDSVYYKKNTNMPPGSPKKLEKIMRADGSVEHPSEEFISDRREFLKKGAALTGGVAAASVGIDLFHYNKERTTSTTSLSREDPMHNKSDISQTPTEQNESQGLKEKQEILTPNETITTTHKNVKTEKELPIEQEHEEVIGKEFMKQVREDGHINVESAKKAIFEKYYKLYGPDGPYHEKMMQGLREGAQWIHEIGASAKEADISLETMMAIAIGESYYQPYAASYTKKNGKEKLLARGPFQFIKSTVKGALMRIKIPLRVEPDFDDPFLDERCDYSKAGHAAVALLNANRTYFKGDLDIAKTGYNGWSKPRDFKKSCNTDGTECTYENFNQWLEVHINNDIDIIRKQYERSYTIGEGDTLEKISRALDITEQELRTYNNISSNDDTIKSGDKLFLPFDQDAFATKIEKMFAKKWKQNFVYPEKINAIEQMLKDTKLLDSLPSEKIAYKEYTVPQEILESNYVIRSGDTLSTIVDLIATQHTAATNTTLSKRIILSLLRKTNDHTIGKNDTIKVGDVLHINLPQKQSLSLAAIAQESSIPMDILKKLNPSILKTHTRLPHDLAIRIPKNI